MTNLLFTLAVLFFIPFLLGYIHVGINKKTNPALIYYRYFITFNIIIAGIFVTIGMFVEGAEISQASGAAYNPIFQLYAISILSMVLMSAITAFSRQIIMLAPAICWFVFLLLSTIVHIYQISQHVLLDTNIVWAHIVYNLLVLIILLRFIFVLKKSRVVA